MNELFFVDFKIFKKGFNLIKFLLKIFCKECSFLKIQLNQETDGHYYFLFNSKNFKINKFFEKLLKFFKKIQPNIDTGVIARKNFKTWFQNQYFRRKVDFEFKVLLRKELFKDLKIQNLFSSFDPASLFYLNKELKKKPSIQFYCYEQKTYFLYSLSKEINQTGRLKAYCKKELSKSQTLSINSLNKQLNKELNINCELQKKKENVKNYLFKMVFPLDRPKIDIINSTEFAGKLVFLNNSRKNSHMEYRMWFLKSNIITKTILTNLFSFSEYN